ncbi:MAG: hypothetical protein WD844_06695 [Thermoleophilaceae bacterium]
MAGIRAGLGVFVAAIALTPAAAWACEEHDPDERERVAGRAGQTLTVEIPNTLAGAEWVIRTAGDEDDEDGDELAKGEDEAAPEGVEAEFEVPDLGEDQKSVELVVEVTHEADGADWSYELELDYRGRPAPEPPKEPKPEPEPDPEPTPEPKADKPPPPSAPDRSSDAQPAPAPAAAKPPPPPPPPAPVVPVERAAPPPPPPAALLLTGGKAPPAVSDLLDGVAAVGTAIPDVLAGASPAQPATEQRSRRRSRRRSEKPEPQAFAPARRRRPPAAPAEEGGIRLPQVDLPGFGSGLAWSLIGGGTLAFALAGLGVAGLGRHRRRRGLALR